MKYNMRKCSLIAVSVLMVSCANTPIEKTSSEVLGGNYSCQSQTVVIDNKPVESSVCIQKVAFQPSKYLVKVDDKVIFKGTDYQEVVFDSQYQSKKVTGGCDSAVGLLKMDGSNKTIAFKELPTKLVQYCGIKQLPNGQSSSFIKDEKCDQVFYELLLPMLGEVAPVGTGTRCVINVDNKEIFNKPF